MVNTTLLVFVGGIYIMAAVGSKTHREARYGASSYASGICQHRQVVCIAWHIRQPSWHALDQNGNDN